jgi:hypothetical protein
MGHPVFHDTSLKHTSKTKGLNSGKGMGVTKKPWCAFVKSFVAFVVIS